MSALPVPETPAGYNPYRLEAAEGPQTLAELRAALAVVDPALVVAFNARHDAAGRDEREAIVTEYRHLWALKTRPDVHAAITASVEHTAELRSAAAIFGELGMGDPAA